MKTQSAKAKGRSLQQDVVRLIKDNFPDLKDNDVRSTSMGAGGEDIVLSPKAIEYAPFSIECKSYKHFGFYKFFDQVEANNPSKLEPLVVCKANRRKPVVIVDAEWFFANLKGN